MDGQSYFGFLFSIAGSTTLGYYTLSPLILSSLLYTSTLQNLSTGRTGPELRAKMFVMAKYEENLVLKFSYRP
jgi:hypothetical protein